MMIRKNGFSAIFSMFAVVAAAAGCAERQEYGHRQFPVSVQGQGAPVVPYQKIAEALPMKAPAVPSYTAEKGDALPPFGYADFCRRLPGECPEQGLRPLNAPAPAGSAPGNTASVVSYNVFAPEGMRTIERVNSVIGGYQTGLARTRGTSVALLQHINESVNHGVLPVTDMAGFGKDELWRVPEIRAYRKDIGDCEDYALLKRKKLMEAGVDFKDLSLSVVRRPNQEIHAVLLVKTEHGDMVLDNLEDEVKLWKDTPYAWLKRQSRTLPYRWVGL